MPSKSPWLANGSMVCTLTPMPPRRPIALRLMDRSERDANGCLIWTGARVPDGRGNYYGRIREDAPSRRVTPTHRASYEANVGLIPDGLVIDHKCRVTLCMEPTHLEPVTQAVNVERSLPAQKSRCLRGHELNDINTYIRGKGNGKRQCRVCHRDQERARRAK